MELERPDEFHAPSGLLSEHFACLLAWDADTVDDATIARVAKRLLQAGTVYVCAWGRGCERVHDVVDAVHVNMAVVSGRMPSVMTTWHSEESLAEATWFLLFAAHPDDAYSATCTASLAIVVGSSARADEIRHAFLDPDAFNPELQT
jgi:hypothetical protein